MKKTLTLLTVLLLFFSTVTLAQNQVKGKVTGKDGSPLSAVSVNVKGTNKGTVTDPDGTFNLDIKSNQATIEFSGIGLETKSVKATAGQTITVTLGEETKSLSEVVITGIGVATSRKKVSIDIGTVSSKDFAKSAIASVEQGIMGQIAGAQIQQTSGQP